MCKGTQGFENKMYMSLFVFCFFFVFFLFFSLYLRNDRYHNEKKAPNKGLLLKSLLFKNIVVPLPYK